MTDFASGTSPLGDLSGLAALRRAPRLFARLPDQLAGPMSELHTLDPEPVSSAVAAAAPTVAWRVGGSPGALRRRPPRRWVGPISPRPVRALAELKPPEGPTVICHGDLHPFNLLVDDDGDVTVIDWTAAIRAEPAYDVAFTSMLLANPPLDAPGPLGAVIGWVGARLAHRFVARYRALAPDHDLGALDWYRALHGARILVEAATLDARHGPGAGGHPFQTLIPAAWSALHAVYRSAGRGAGLTRAVPGERPGLARRL